ncbi:MAG: hypothetical protein LDL50_05690 [Chloroflexi bacterium]|nr:hypothetical protein [Chloroflexota bacterium]MCA2002846.1 hypothetical protein [Chloroflexota bacterium]
MKGNPLSLIFLVFALAACGPARQSTAILPDLESPVSSEDTPMPQNAPALPPNSSLPRGNVYLDSAELLTLESYPPQFTLLLKGSLPTPCHQLQVDVQPPDAENNIWVEAYSLANPNRVCAQVLKPFEENLPLGTFPAGRYTLWVNGEKLAEFDA